MSRDLILWTSMKEVVVLTDAELAQWKARGVDGFVASIGWLRGWGGNQQFYVGTGPIPSYPYYDLQRQLLGSQIIQRAAAAGLSIRLGFYLANIFATAVPLEGWFSAGGWGRAEGYVGNVAAGAKLLGFAGLAIDAEVYRPGPSWLVAYEGNTRGEAHTRATVKTRGSQFGSAVADAWPGASITVTSAPLPGGWSDHVQEEVNGIPHASDNLVHVDFWDGVFSHPGIARVRFLEPIFYKMTHFFDVSWATALAYDRAAFDELAKPRGWKGWYGQRSHRLPFAWIDSGPPLPYGAAQDPAVVAAQLAAFRTAWSDEPLFVFAYSGLRSFDYGPYVPAMVAVS